MNILLISRCPPYPLHLGDRLILYHLAQVLSARGHQIDLLAFYNQADDLQQLGHYQSFFHTVRLIPEPKRNGVSYIGRLIDPHRRFPTRREQSWSAGMWDAIEAQLAAVKYDVVHLFGGVHVYEYRNLVSRRPTVIVPYESFSLYLQRLYDQQSSLIKKVAIGIQLAVTRRYEWIMYEGYNEVVVLANPDQKALLALNPKLSISVIPNGVDTGYFTPSHPVSIPNGDSPALVFVGNMEYAPNTDAALWLASEIFPKVKQQVSSARLMLVGNNPPESLQQLASTDIEVTGWVPDVRPYLEKADIFISPLRIGAGIKNKVLETMAMAKPVVATPLSADGIDIEEGTHVLFADSTEAMTSAIIRLLNDPQLRQKMALSNRQFIEQHFTWERVVDQYEMLYRHIVSTQISNHANHG